MCFLRGLFFSVTVSADAQPPTDNPFATYDRVQHHWTDDFSWNRVVDASHVTNLISDDANIDSLRLHQTMDSISELGGGVLFFPPGKYYLNYDVKLACGVVIRGGDTQGSEYKPSTQFEFPRYRATFEGDGAPTKSAFKKFYSDSRSSCLLGLVNLDLNRVQIVLHHAENKPLERNQQILLFGLRQNNAGVCNPNIPTPIQVAEGKGWQRWLFSFTGMIDLGNAANCTISKCTLNDSITDSFDQPGYLTDFGHKFSGEQARFDFSRQNGILINAHHFQTELISAKSASPLDGGAQLNLQNFSEFESPSPPALIEILDCDVTISEGFKAIISSDSLDRNIGNEIRYLESAEKMIEEHGQFALADYWDKDIFAKGSFKSKSGAVLNYRQLTPVDYNPDQAYPLILFLHGGGENGNDNTSQLKHFVNVFGGENLNNYPAFVLAPQCPDGERWSNWPADESWMLKSSIELIKTISGSFNIDKNRIYVIGLANRGCWEILLRHRKMFAAAVAMSTTWKFSNSDLKKLSKTPIWIFNGAKDQYNPIQYVEVSILKMKKSSIHRP